MWLTFLMRDFAIDPSISVMLTLEGGDCNRDIAPSLVASAAWAWQVNLRKGALVMNHGMRPGDRGTFECYLGSFSIRARTGSWSEFK